MESAGCCQGVSSHGRRREVDWSGSGPQCNSETCWYGNPPAVNKSIERSGVRLDPELKRVRVLDQDRTLVIVRAHWGREVTVRGQSLVPDDVEAFPSRGL